MTADIIRDDVTTLVRLSKAKTVFFDNAMPPALQMLKPLATSSFQDYESF